MNLPSLPTRKYVSIVVYLLCSFFVFLNSGIAKSDGGCISGLAASTPVCNGGITTFNVSFTAVGTFQVLDGTTVLATGNSSPIKVTLTRPTTAGGTFFTVRYVGNCDEAVLVNLTDCMPAIPTMSQWGIMLLGLLILNLSLVLLFRKGRFIS